MAPPTPKQNPEDPIRRPEFRAAAFEFEDGQLLAEGEILDDDIQPRSKEEAGKRDQSNPQQPNHAGRITGGLSIGKARGRETRLLLKFEGSPATLTASEAIE